MNDSIKFSDFLESNDTLNTVLRKLNYNNRLINEYLANNNNLHKELINISSDHQTLFTLLDGHYDNTLANALKVVLNGNVIDSSYIKYNSNNTFTINTLGIVTTDILEVYYVPIERVPTDSIKEMISNYNQVTSKLDSLNSLVNSINDTFNNDLPTDLQSIRTLIPTLENYNDKLQSLSSGLADKVSIETFNSELANSISTGLDEANKSTEYLPNYYFTNYSNKTITEHKVVDSTGTINSGYILKSFVNTDDKVIYQEGITDGRVLLRRSYPQVDKDSTNRIVSDAVSYLTGISVIPDTNEVNLTNIELYVSAMSNSKILALVDNKSNWINSNRVINDRNSILGISSNSTTNSDLVNLMTIMRNDISTLSLISDDTTNRWITWSEVGGTPSSTTSTNDSSFYPISNLIESSTISNNTAFSSSSSDDSTVSSPYAFTTDYIKVLPDNDITIVNYTNDPIIIQYCFFENDKSIYSRKNDTSIAGNSSLVIRTNIDTNHIRLSANLNKGIYDKNLGIFLGDNYTKSWIPSMDSVLQVANQYTDIKSASTLKGTIDDTKLKGGNLSLTLQETLPEVENEITKLNLNSVVVPVKVNVNDAADSKPELDNTQLSNQISLMNSIHNDLPNVKIIVKAYPWIQNGGKAASEWEPSDTSAWKNYYETAIVTLAGSIPSYVSGLCIGTCLSHMEILNDYWSRIVLSIKNNFSGTTMYETNWWETYDTPSNTQFLAKLESNLFGLVDVISISSYFKVTNKDNPNVEELKSNLMNTPINSQNIISEITKLHNRWNKPIILGTLGILPYSKAASHPAQFTKNSSDTNSETIQSSWYEAWKESLETFDWFNGLVLSSIADNSNPYSLLTNSTKEYISNSNFVYKVVNGSAGETTTRPAGVSTGYQYFDTTLEKPVWYTGQHWVDSEGETV